MVGKHATKFRAHSCVFEATKDPAKFTQVNLANMTLKNMHDGFPGGSESRMHQSLMLWVEPGCWFQMIGDLTSQGIKIVHGGNNHSHEKVSA